MTVDEILAYHLVEIDQYGTELNYELMKNAIDLGADVKILLNSDIKEVKVWTKKYIASKKLTTKLEKKLVTKNIKEAKIKI